MRYVAAVLSALGSAAAANAEGKKKEFVWPADKKGKDPVAQRTDPPLVPYEHSFKRTGYPNCLSRLAAPGLTKHYAGGYVGGDTLKRGHHAGPCEGTYGVDYLTFRGMYDRLFLKFGGGRQQDFLGRYNQDGPRLGDPIAAAPFRKAVVEARHEHGSLLHHTPPKGHGEGGH